MGVNKREIRPENVSTIVFFIQAFPKFAKAVFLLFL